ncbi:MAG: arylsulfatase [Lentisphaerae bacterium RIFOXYB12_FULL_65_16]|nr:MAG: arylsulfatase [Lentisphaerae bacterium RIFOXYA12_64_32]OGV93179.1 MAG: arylsulfatase [Lentisphaerae bacterium RIFOXYB12_FULL_65_16]
MPEPRPNILLIHVDQWRTDCLGCAGHSVVETPHLDALAGESVRFSRAYAAVPSCIASRASLLTGLTPRSHGRVGYRDGVPWNYPVTLPGLLAGAGYHTQAVGKMHVDPARNLVGFHNVVLHDGYLHFQRKRQRDFGLFDDYLHWLQREHGPLADYIDTGLGCNGYAVRPWIYEDMLHPTAWVTTQSIDFLRRRDPSKPFFLYASYHRPHPPLDPPRDYLHMYEGKDLPPLPRGDWADAFNQTSYHGLDSPKPSSPAAIARARRAYYAQLTFIDHQINRLTHALYEHDVLANTCILFCSDHGDMLYDHGFVAKSLPYEGSAGVPFLLRLPTAWKVPRRRTLEMPVEMRDVLPTLCDVAGVAVPSSVEGQSLVPLCRGETVPWREYIHGEHPRGDLSNHWLTDGRMKYAWYSQTGREQLFDLANDPQELHDLAPDRAADVAAWRERLVRELTGREEGYVQDSRLVVGRAPLSVLASATARAS